MVEDRGERKRQRKKGHEKELRRPAMGGSGGGGIQTDGDGHTTKLYSSVRVKMKPAGSVNS